jgi:uncharacterized protein YndB with AHSA1/START domain
MLPPIVWRVHLTSLPELAFELWTTDPGRERFWARESRPGTPGFQLSFANGQKVDVEIVEAVRPRRFAFRYFGGSLVTVEFEPAGNGGCDVTLREHAPPPAEHLENYAGWVAVLLAFKAAADFGVDLRSHDPDRSWERRFVDV